MVTWVNQVGTYSVERKEIPRAGGYVLMPSPYAFVIHTTEGSTVSSAWNTLNAAGIGPHFIVGEERIMQTRPLDVQGSALVSHNDMGWQVEVVGFSKEQPYFLPASSWNPLVALSGYMHSVLGVPYARPTGWNDDLSDISTTLASNNTRRQSRKALDFAGFIGHIDVPDQSPTWHWDPGALRYTELFKEAEVAMLDDYIAGIDGYQAAYAAAGNTDPGVVAANKPAYYKKGWGDARWSVLNVPSGVPGTTGVTGVTGAKGTTGTTGTTGASGQQGMQGIQGIQGGLGPAGTTGATGVEGGIGPEGDVGATGASGARGDTGTTGSTGATGASGPGGFVGASGAPGTTGATGVTGVTGAKGTKGDKGTTGATGSTGLQGIQGTQGLTGNDGINGAPGADGEPGPTGPEGPPGQDGATGPQGEPGPTHTHEDVVVAGPANE